MSKSQVLGVLTLLDDSLASLFSAAHALNGIVDHLIIVSLATKQSHIQDFMSQNPRFSERVEIFLTEEIGPAQQLSLFITRGALKETDEEYEWVFFFHENSFLIKDLGVEDLRESLKRIPAKTDCIAIKSEIFIPDVGFTLNEVDDFSKLKIGGNIDVECFPKSTVKGVSQNFRFFGYTSLCHFVRAKTLYGTNEFLDLSLFTEYSDTNNDLAGFNFVKFGFFNQKDLESKSEIGRKLILDGWNPGESHIYQAFFDLEIESKLDMFWVENLLPAEYFMQGHESNLAKTNFNIQKSFSETLAYIRSFDEDKVGLNKKRNDDNIYHSKEIYGQISESIKNEQRHLWREIQQRDAVLANRDAAVADLIQQRDAVLADRDAAVADLIQQRDAVLADRDAAVADLIQQRDAVLADRDAAVADLIQQRDAVLADRDAAVADLIQQRDAVLADRDAAVADLIQQRDAVLADRDAAVADLIQQRDAVLADRDAAVADLIQQRDAVLADRDAAVADLIQQRDAVLADRDAAVADLIQQRDAVLADRDAAVADLIQLRGALTFKLEKIRSSFISRHLLKKFFKDQSF